MLAHGPLVKASHISAARPKGTEIDSTSFFAGRSCKVTLHTNRHGYRNEKNMWPFLHFTTLVLFSYPVSLNVDLYLYSYCLQFMSTLDCPNLRVLDAMEFR